MQKLINLDGNEKGGFADSQPAGPAHAKHQTDAFDERKEAIDERAGGGPENFRLGELADLAREVGPKLTFRVQPQMMQQIFVISGQIVV